jgi:primosomal protein N' (replication factor Y) (superfamily II helicase)
LPGDLGAGVGSLVQVRFHGRSVRGWVLGPADEMPARTLPVSKVVSPTRWFDAGGLELCRWVSERYVAPLAAVLERATPPRVAAEEDPDRSVSPVRPAPPPSRDPEPVLEGYRGGPEMRAAIERGDSGVWIARPAPEHEAAATIEAVDACLRRGRRALVLVPEAEPVPHTARALVDAFGDQVASILGGSKRKRYRSWLDVQAGRFAVVVGTRPSVFAPVPDLGLIYVDRESHPAFREDRAPYYHVRDVALARGRIEGVPVVLAALAPSSEAAAMRVPTVSPRRRRWVPV